MKVWSETLGGNLHQASITINRDDFWVKWDDIVAMSFTGGYTVVVFKVSDEEYTRLKDEQEARNKRIDEKQKENLK